MYCIAACLCIGTYVQHPIAYMKWIWHLLFGVLHNNLFYLYACSSLLTLLMYSSPSGFVHLKCMLILLIFLSSCVWRFACEKLEIILTSGVNKIDQLVHECFSLVEAGGDSPVWSSCLHQINAFVLRGLKDAFMSAIGSLLRRVELYEQVLNTSISIRLLCS